MLRSICSCPGPRLTLAVFRRQDKTWTAGSTFTRPKSYSTSKDFEDLLSKPAWSVKSLLPSDESISDAEVISPNQLRHLLHISALPVPKTAEDEDKMIRTLGSQLHFVRAIREVDTKGVSPLPSVRDETSAAMKDLEISVHSLQNGFAQEELVGKHFRRIKRRTGTVDENAAEDWDVLGSAERKVGKYFVVDSGKTA